MSDPWRSSTLLWGSGLVAALLGYAVFQDQLAGLGRLFWPAVSGLILVLIVLRLVGDRRRRARRRGAPRPAVLILSGDRRLSVASAAELAEGLNALALLKSGERARLFRGDEDYAEATRHGELWSAAARCGGWWTLHAFTADLTTDYSERKVRESRAAGSLRKRLALIFASPPAEFQLSTGQVRTIFTEYFLDRPFSLGA